MNGKNIKLIAYCGINCAECEAYTATQAGDEKKAQEMINKASEAMGKNLTLDDFWCDGCPADGRKCSYCGECAIRRCAREKNLANCAHCPDYRCEVLSAFLAGAGKAGDTLDDIRRNL